MCRPLTGLQSLSYKSNLKCTILWFFISFTLYEHCPKYCLQWLSTVPLVFGWILYVKYLFLITSDSWTPCAKEQRQETRGTCWGLPRSSICRQSGCFLRGYGDARSADRDQKWAALTPSKGLSPENWEPGRFLSRKVVWTHMCFSKVIFGCI